MFERQGKRNVLTTAGRQYLDAIAPAIFTIESTTQAMRRKREGRRVRLSMPLHAVQPLADSAPAGLQCSPSGYRAVLRSLSAR